MEAEPVRPEKAATHAVHVAQPAGDQQATGHVSERGTDHPEDIAT